MADLAEIKHRNRATWAAGDWDEASNLIADVGPRLLDRVGIEAGMDVLDVGTGSGGTVAIPAALRGGRVIGSDLTPEHFEHARTDGRDQGRMAVQDAEVAFAARYDDHVGLGRENLALGHDQPEGDLGHLTRPPRPRASWPW